VSFRGTAWGVAAVAGLLAVVALAAASPALGARARTLVVSPSRINGFAQDGRFVAWIARAPNTWSPFCGRTHIRNLETGRERSFGTRNRPVCGDWVALGRGRALWAADPGICGNCSATAVYTGALGDPRVVRVGVFVRFGNLNGTQLTGLTADGRLRAFSWVTYEDVDAPPPCCTWDVTGGRAARVVGRERHFVQVPRPAELAAGVGRLAVAPSRDPIQGTGPVVEPAEDGPVDVVDADTATPVMSVTPTGTVRALALSGGALAVLLERADGSRRIERYAIPTGTLIASTWVDEHVSRDLDIAGKWIVYRVWRQIRIVDAAGAKQLLVKTRFRPTDVSIEGRRVAWAENGGGRHRIRAVFTPG
jgi:hypothetical protein